MRVTNRMLLNQAIYDLDGLREKYAKAQGAVNGRALERPSDDPQKVVEAMDLAGAKMRLERMQRSGQDAKVWLQVSEQSVTNMIDQVQSARELAVQAGSPLLVGDQGGREALAATVIHLRDGLVQEMNTRHGNQYVFSGWNSNTKPFSVNGTGGVTYTANNSGDVSRDIADGLSVTINVSGDKFLAQGDFIQTLTTMADDLLAGRMDRVTTTGLTNIDKAFQHLNLIRSDLGLRQQQVEQYAGYARDALVSVQQRLSTVSGTDVESAVMSMIEAQNAYQTALSSFSKALPTSLLDYLPR